jgi:hypothetical protein
MIATHATSTTQYAARTGARGLGEAPVDPPQSGPGYHFQANGRRRLTSWVIRVADEMRAEWTVVDCCSLEILLICADDLMYGVPDSDDAD